MKIASNPQRDADLLEAPSIRAALELLSDKEPTGRRWGMNRSWSMMIRIATRFGGENDMRISAHHFSFSVLARLF